MSRTGLTETAPDTEFADSPTGVRLQLTHAALGRTGAEPVLRDVELSVQPGELLTVVGPSGCGKSTLLRTLAGLLPALGGEVSGDGRRIEWPAAERALIFQDDALLPWRTLRRNVALPLALRGVPRTERRTQADDWLARVGLTGNESRLPHQVSGGQRQRAQLARALAGRPRALLMDEPFGALDAQTRAGMQQLLTEVLADTRATVVFVTHDVDEAVFLGDRVALLSGGSGGSGGSGTEPVRVWEVPHPRDRAAHAAPETVALRRTVLTALSDD